MPYDDFESMLYGITPTESETPKQEEPKRPQEKPVERLGATSAGSGCGWHLSALVGLFWGFWRRF